MCERVLSFVDTGAAEIAACETLIPLRVIDMTAS